MHRRLAKSDLHHCRPTTPSWYSLAVNRIRRWGGSLDRSSISRPVGKGDSPASRRCSLSWNVRWHKAWRLPPRNAKHESVQDRRPGRQAGRGSRGRVGVPLPAQVVRTPELALDSKGGVGGPCSGRAVKMPQPPRKASIRVASWPSWSSSSPRSSPGPSSRSSW
jgi:hypothetical protein